MKHLLEPWYVTGLIDSAGTFTFSRSGTDFTMYFAVKVGVRDLNLLQEIQGFFGGAGRIYQLRASRGTSNLKREFGSSGHYFRITKRRELLLVVAHFHRYPLRSQKADQYRVWREMVEQKSEFRKSDRRLLAELASNLTALR